MRLGSLGQAAAQRLGYEIHPHLPDRGPLARRGKILREWGVSVVLDIGAATGLYAAELRRVGYTGRIVSFEPLSDAFAELAAAAQDDPGWDCRRLALGAEDGSAEINVSGTRDSSSFLEMGERHVRGAPGSRYVGTEMVEVARLDSIWDDIVRPGDRAMLKLDVQGFELEALRGAERSLGDTVAVQAELSLVPVYEHGPLYQEVIAHLEARGFRLAGLEPGFEDLRTGEVLQADGTFVRDPQ